MISAIGSVVATWHPPPRSYEMNARRTLAQGSHLSPARVALLWRGAKRPAPPRPAGAAPPAPPRAPAASNGRTEARAGEQTPRGPCLDLRGGRAGDAFGR